MNVIRRDEELDNLHSVYVDQWDWEKVIAPRDPERGVSEADRTHHRQGHVGDPDHSASVTPRLTALPARARR